MPIKSQTYTQVRFNPAVNRVATTVRDIDRSIGNSLGLLQIKLGIKPTFIRTSRVALEQWKNALHDVTAPMKNPILVAAIRNQRWIEWAIYSACYMVQMGYRPIVLYSKQKIVDIYGNYLIGEDRGTFWDGLQGIPYIQLIDLDEYMKDSSVISSYEKFIAKAVHTVAAYDLRVEEYEPEQAPGEYQPALQRAEKMLSKYICAISSILGMNLGERLICPSGLIGESLAFYEVAKRLNLTTVYVEGWALRPGHNIWNINQPALEYDIVGWMKVLGEWNNTKEIDAQAYMAFREGTRIDHKDNDQADWLDNFHQVQRKNVDAPLPKTLTKFLERPGPIYMLGTNVVGDSSTLRRATIFRSQQDWIEQVIGFFRQHSELNLVVRAHPDEAWVNARLRLGNIARSFRNNAENIYIIGGDEDMNSYSLIKHSDVGLAWVSNIGLDMAIRGIPVIMAAAAKYSGLGVCHEPQTRDEYFQMILDFAVHPIAPDEASIRRAKAYHHIVFKMMSLYADSPRYKAADYRLGRQYVKPDQDKFFRILVGELSDKGFSIENKQA